MDNERARQLFFDYCGSHFYMIKDGVWTEYASHKISDRVEKKWRDELLNVKWHSLREQESTKSFSSKLSSLFSVLGDKISKKDLQRAINVLSEAFDKLDGFDRLVSVEVLLKRISIIRVGRRRLVQELLALSETIVQQKALIRVPEGYKNLISEDDINERVKDAHDLSMKMSS